MLLGPNDLSKLLPLIKRRVDSSGVVSTRVQENDGLIRSVLDRLLHPLKVQSLSLLVEVRVVGCGKTDIVEDLVVVRPCGIRDVDGTVALEELGEEECTQVDGTGARDGLYRGRALLPQSGRVGAQHQLGGLGCEALDTGDRGVLMVEFGVRSENVIRLMKMPRSAPIL